MLQFQKRSWLRDHASVPITAAYVVAALVLGWQGSAVGERVFGSSAVSVIASDSATAILAAIASGMMALTAIVFSIVFVVIQVAGTSYSPRVVDLFGRGTFMGHAIGVFTGTFMYALFALRTVNIAGTDGVNISVIAVAMLWLLASVAFVILLLPRLRSLTIAVVLPKLHHLASVAIARAYQPLADGVSRTVPAPTDAAGGLIVHLGSPCYLHGFDARRLVEIAKEIDAVIVISDAIGDAVITGDALAIVVGAERPVPEARIRHAMWLGPQRLIDNDPAYALRLLVDIAIRALSPAINDPTTAVSVLDQIDGILRKLGGMELEDNVVLDEDCVVRVVREVPSWDDLVAVALTEIHEYGRDSIQVQRRLAALLHDLPRALPPARRSTIERFARWRTSHESEPWRDALAFDRQGLGHEISH